jgi:hypothetical protein
MRKFGKIGILNEYRNWIKKNMKSNIGKRLEGIDIDREYELIKQKKSRLSCKMRNLVVSKKEIIDDKNKTV